MFFVYEILKNFFSMLLLKVKTFDLDFLKGAGKNYILE